MVRDQIERLRISRSSVGQVAERRQSAGPFCQEICALGVRLHDVELLIQNGYALVELQGIEQVPQAHEGWSERSRDRASCGERFLCRRQIMLDALFVESSFDQGARGSDRISFVRESVRAPGQLDR